MSELNIAELLADQLDKLLSAEVGAESLAALEEGVGTLSLWQQVEEMGIADVMRSGADDAGLGWQDCAELFRVLGRHAAPLPLAETLIGRGLLSSVGMTVPDGPLALIEDVLTLDANGVLQGRVDMMTWAPWASHWVGVAEQSGESRLFCVARGEGEAVTTLERAPTLSVDLTGVQALAVAPIADATLMRSQFALARALMISGACDKVVELAVEYANTRKQFGKPIGKFQALQHQLAEASCRAAATEMAAKYACRKLDLGEHSSGAAVAKYTAGVAAKEVSRIAHQVFGAIGITDEHELHYFTRRLWQWRVDGGSERYWSEQLGSRVLQAGAAQLWSSLTA
ncbi:acyl-CoA dehydrogenase [Spongiibacter sp. KMU-166]|uniref:Acyl-CoA dehydrogenase n=1 Tax=Spongiibacter thalassae TaxID=2721624 RepID=A0ABX1GCL5_9GAMM|nr:acyl-CoA dehydrogenase family protein [Spongiibacter thalassae]NKI16343.1 acyl-CoA dehydrogenase [Spongiibacter thalassae]